MKRETSIEGTLLMLDDKTPHVAVPVQAICDGEVIATTLSDESGRYRFIGWNPETHKYVYIYEEVYNVSKLEGIAKSHSSQG